MEKVKQILNKLPVRAVLIGLLAFFIVFTCPVMAMTPVYAEKSPELATDSITVRVDDVRMIRIRNI